MPASGAATAYAAPTPVPPPPLRHRVLGSAVQMAGMEDVCMRAGCIATNVGVQRWWVGDRPFDVYMLYRELFA